jgi:hypothetical protein
VSHPKVLSAFVLAAALSGAHLVAQDAQEQKPVPKDSARVSIPGCSKGYIFTAGPRTEDQPGSLDVPEGLHLRMNGPKKILAEIKAHEGSVIVLTGLVKKGQYLPGGVGIGGGARVGAAPGPGGGLGAGAVLPQVFIDVEGWRPGTGNCPARR